MIFLYGPKGLSAPIVKKLGDAANNASQSPLFREVVNKYLLHTKKNMFGEELGRFLNTEKIKTGELLKKLGLGKK